ncbi:MAG: Pyruvate:ferredoxin oxidoreductase gamma subunit [Pelotomaculum thermopropionicum]|uniref:Pyruvate:ferredoxin oxidoreductase gamma subunit n=1 Tax=Pelotomaculum thermopropionicum TaxID=110500 RepID=A0A101HRJ7_9FIRM|nr:MAG: Pyruvate:ferredoxin oxidoreductase gamma subunit [Pelotomaculum thermopropionicum]
MSKTSEIVLSGSGGQGLILAGQILAEAVIKDGKNTVQTQSYGPEARGGASKAEVIISEAEIDYPKVTHPDIILVMSNEALLKYAGMLKPGGSLIIDTTYVKDLPSTQANVLAVPYSRIAKETLNKEMVSNIVALGALAAFTGVVSKESLETALMSRIPRGTEDLNQKALELGWKSAGEAAA